MNRRARCLLASVLLCMTMAVASAAPGRTPGAPGLSWETALRDKGLAASEDVLQGMTQTPGIGFMLGGVRFLRSLEYMLQVRYQNSPTTFRMIPGMSASLPENPKAVFHPEFLDQAMSGALILLSAAETSLQTSLGKKFTIQVDMRDIWLDVDKDGVRDEWEGLLDLVRTVRRSGSTPFEGTIQFDRADAQWLCAYIHLLSGCAELVLSIDTTPALQQVREGRSAMEALGPLAPLGISRDENFLETLTSLVLALRGVPDRTRTRSARVHFKEMVRHNRLFWQDVEQETDDVLEWLPNSRQSSAIGVPVQKDVAQNWQVVLDEFDAILDGQKLIPYWRMARGKDSKTGVGVNLFRLLEDPGDMDPILWIQGSGAVPFLEEGELLDRAALRNFRKSAAGNMMLYAIWFN